MHAVKIVHQILSKSCPQIHVNRLVALVDVVDALTRGQTLTVTGLGRASVRDISMKQGIKHSDRLVGNPHLRAESPSIYQAVSRYLIGETKRPLILIDWSDYTHDRKQLILRASVPVGGRALTLYEEVHPGHCYGNAGIQRAFLKTLYGIIPAQARPIVITDAGFMSPWFAAVEKLGWDYIGRLRGNLYYRASYQQDWLSCAGLQRKARSTPDYYGEVEIARYRPFHCHLYVYKKQNKGRVNKTRYGDKARSKHSQKNAQRERSPWLLVSSISQETLSAKQVIQLYRTRMQIEEGFRGIKNQRTGFSLSNTRTRSPERLANLLMLGMLAMLVVWLMGRLAEEKRWHYQYQANTVKNHRVLSLFYLGCLLVVQGQFNFTQLELQYAIKLVQQDMLNQWIS